VTNVNLDSLGPQKAFHVFLALQSYSLHLPVVQIVKETFLLQQLSMTTPFTLIHIHAKLVIQTIFLTTIRLIAGLPFLIANKQVQFSTLLLMEFIYAKTVVLATFGKMTIANLVFPSMRTVLNVLSLEKFVPNVYLLTFLKLMEGLVLVNSLIV